jgi:penicillin-binding protein 1C
MRFSVALVRLFSYSALVAGLAAIGLVLVVARMPLPEMSRVVSRSQLVLSSSGEPLWGFLAPDGKWRFSISVADADPKFLRMLIAYEDKRFYSHRGVDFLALGRACIEAIRSRGIVSGASTLTMQVVRLLEPKPRSLGAKLDQILKAFKLERAYTKEEILGIYLTLAPYGGNVEGLRAASLIYFGEEPRRLSAAEAALLTALPQSPEARRPDRHPEAARAARDRILMTLASRGILEPGDIALSMKEKIPLGARTLTFRAPHLASRARNRSPPGQEITRTLIDHDLQAQVERIASHAIVQWDDGVSIAIVVIRNRDSSFAAYVGGVDFGADSRSGQVDLVQAVRSPGSALKPFIYALAFEKLIVHPETIITDEAIDIAGYQPENADGQFAGDLSVRQALIRSRNTIAVRLLDKVGVDVLLSRFRATGRPLALAGSDHSPGLAVALGGVGVSLDQLTWFYSAFANDGRLGAIRLFPSDPARPLSQLLSVDAARATADVLADVPPPAGYVRQTAADGGRRIGFKTGTSYGFRDAWAVGFDRLHTVGVWVGRPDGAAHLGAYGITAAAPLLMQVFDLLPRPATDVKPAEADVGALTPYRELPKRLARFDSRPGIGSGHQLEISYPRNGAVIRSDQPRGASVELGITVSGGTPPYRWIFGGKPQPTTDLPTKNWPINDRGQFDIKVIDGSGVVAESSFWLD